MFLNEFLHYKLKITYSTRNVARDVGRISNLGGTTLRGHFFLKKKGAFLKIKRALLCLLENLGGHVPPVPPGSYVYAVDHSNREMIP